MPNYLFRHLYTRLNSTHIYTVDPPVELEATFSDYPRPQVKIKGPASFDYIYFENYRSIFERFLNI